MSGTSILTYLVLSISVIYIFVYPSYQEISLLMGEKTKYEDYLEMAANLENKTNELRTKFNKISVSDKKNIDTVLPDSLDFVRLIAQIDDVARSQGIRINKTSFREVDPSVGGSIAEAGPEKPYRSAVISFSFDASYVGFNNLIDSLEKSLRILDIKSVKIGTSDKGLYSYTVELEAYWLKTS